MTPNLLTTFGTLLFGQRWHTDLARAVKVSERTVRRWSQGYSYVPDGVWDELAALARARMVEIRAALKEAGL